MVKIDPWEINLWKIIFFIAVCIYKLYSLLTSHAIEEREHGKAPVGTNELPFPIQTMHQEPKAILQGLQMPLPALEVEAAKKEYATRLGPLVAGTENKSNQLGSSKRKFFKRAFLIQEVVKSKFV